jgi:hypothetical protein
MVYVELSLYYGRRSVDHFVLVSGSPLGPMTSFYPFLTLVTIVLMFFLLGALSDERTGLWFRVPTLTGQVIK